MKKPKFTPIHIHSRDGMRAIAADLVANKLALAKLQIRIEERKAAVEREHQERYDEITRAIQMQEAGLHIWSQTHRDGPEFAGKKSIELPQCIFGFRFGKHKVEKSKTKDTWGDIAARLISYVSDTFVGSDYIRYGDPAVDKDALLGIRDQIPPEACRAIGIKIDQEEFFYFEPKSDVIDATSQSAA